MVFLFLCSFHCSCCSLFQHSMVLNSFNMNIPSLLGVFFINFTLSFHCSMLSPCLSYFLVFFFIFRSMLEAHVFSYDLSHFYFIMLTSSTFWPGGKQDKILWLLACNYQNIFQIISFPCTIIFCVYWTVFWIKFILVSWTLRMGLIGPPKTMARNYHNSLCNNPEEHSSKFKWTKTCIRFSNSHFFF